MFIGLSRFARDLGIRNCLGNSLASLGDTRFGWSSLGRSVLGTSAILVGCFAFNERLKAALDSPVIVCGALLDSSKIGQFLKVDLVVTVS